MAIRKDKNALGAEEGIDVAEGFGLDERPEQEEKLFEPVQMAVVTKPAAEAPLSLHELALKFRVPAWQQAAVNRLMGWDAGKRVRPSDYEAALGGLKGRNIGG